MEVPLSQGKMSRLTSIMCYLPDCQLESLAAFWPGMQGQLIIAGQNNLN